jgi:FMN-dependent oxidoreductase (nitrilotriacetate monooxygenase family)
MTKIVLGLSMKGLGYHPTAWRDPEMQADAAMDIRHAINVAQIAERGLFDFVFLADQSALVMRDTPKGVLGRHPNANAELEPLTVLSALSTMTSRVGLIATASTTFHQPYQLARQFLSLDHISGGRAGWNAVTSSRNEEAQNYGDEVILEKSLRYERAKEAMEVMFGLWESWEEDAFPRDRQTGVFFDPAKMHRINHEGKYFRVRGPLTMPRSTQGRPIIAQAGASPGGRDFAAAVADVVYAVQTELSGAKAFYKDMKERVRRAGRNPDHVKIMPGLLPTVGKTTEEAEAKYRRMLSHLDPLVGRERIERFFGDLTGYDLDGPLPDLRTDIALVSRADLNLRLAREQNWTIRQLYESTVISHGHHVATGTAAEIADTMESWIEEEAADGFNIVPPLLPVSATDFVDMVVPELQRRGRFRTEYEGLTLRDHLGLPAIAPRYP